MVAASLPHTNFESCSGREGFTEGEIKMGNYLFKAEAPPPVVLVPPLFERPQLTERSRMLESSYDLLFSKLARAKLFRDYFEEADYTLGRIILQPADDPRVDVTATVRAQRTGVPGARVGGEAVFRMQRDANDPYTFWDLMAGSSNNILKFRACSYDPLTKLGVFAVAPVLTKKRVEGEDFGSIGFRYSTNLLSAGFVASPLMLDIFHSRAWLVSKVGPFTAGVQYKPYTSLGELQPTSWDDRRNWSIAVDYGTASKGVLKPSFNFCLEVIGDSKLIASYYHHLVVQRRVKNPLEDEAVVGITNYVDVGFEFETRLREDEEVDEALRQPTSMQLAASWQANKNVLLKAKIGTVSSVLAFCFKSWWQPSVTFSFAVARDHLTDKTRFGFGIRSENFGGVSYERADPNYVMLTPSKTHEAEGIMRDLNQRPVLQDDVDSGRSEKLPAELRPLDDIL
ncbi:hypothetical protein R1sor_006006 [Riccia sorocarpa]|uniref:Uncharacterized protein n=1 Tax=Riccia sorocarpa TaxID=122646 RepID=A0ABD3HL62_9MARC